jgi:hypothetical protein
MNLDNINMIYLIPVAVFGLFAVAAWWLFDMFSQKNSRAEDRLAELNDPLLRKNREGNASTSEAMTKMLENVSPALAKLLQPKNDKTPTNLNVS